MIAVDNGSATVILPTTTKDGKAIATRTRPLLELSIFLNKLDPGKPWEVIVRRWKKSRTNEQNAALFGLAYKIIGQATGHTNDELHEAFCKAFFGTVEKLVFGKLQSKPFRTTTTDEHGKRDVIPWDEFSEFYARVEATAASANIIIPPPDPSWKTRKNKQRATT